MAHPYAPLDFPSPGGYAPPSTTYPPQQGYPPTTTYFAPTPTWDASNSYGGYPPQQNWAPPPTQPTLVMAPFATDTSQPYYPPTTTYFPYGEAQPAQPAYYPSQPATFYPQQDQQFYQTQPTQYPPQQPQTGWQAQPTQYPPQSTYPQQSQQFSPQYPTQIPQPIQPQPTQYPQQTQPQPTQYPPQQPQPTQYPQQQQPPPTQYPPQQPSYPQPTQQPPQPQQPQQPQPQPQEPQPTTPTKPQPQQDRNLPKPPSQQKRVAATFKFDYKDRATFYGALVDTAKTLLNDSKKLVDTLTGNAADLEKKAGGSGALKQQFTMAIENLYKLSDKLAALIHYGAKEILQDDTAAEFLKGTLSSLTHSTNSMLTAATSVLAESGNVQEEVQQTTKRHGAVVLAIKNILQAAEFVKDASDKGHSGLKQSEEKKELKEKIEAAEKKQKLPIKRGRPSPGFTVSDFNDRDILAAQKLYKRGLLRYRLQQLVLEFKESKLSDDQRKRAHVLREIVATEETYVGMLEICIDKYLVPMREDLKRGKHYMSDQDLPSLFSTIELIHQVNKDMLHDLQERLKQWPTVNSFGPVFISMVPMMKIYTSYIKNYDDAMKLFWKLSEGKIFAARIEELRLASGAKLDLPSLLITPVQRLPRYQLLLRELLKHTDPSHVDYDDLSVAIAKVQDLTTSINEKKREADNERMLSDLQSRVHNMPLILKNQVHRARRLFIREGDFACTSAKFPKKTTSHIFLFNDLVLRVHEIKKGESYEFEESLQLSETKLNKINNLTLELSKPDTTWTLEVKDDIDLKNWYEEFKQTIEAWQLQELCNMELLNTSTARLQILSATYGDLSDPKSCIDVTQQLRDMCDGTKLEIAGGTEKSKLPGFVDPLAQAGWGLASLRLRKRKKQLTIAWTDMDGAHTSTWGDTEPVVINYQS